MITVIFFIVLVLAIAAYKVRQDIKHPEQARLREQAKLDREVRHYDRRAVNMSAKIGRGGKRAAKAAERAEALRAQRDRLNP